LLLDHQKELEKQVRSAMQRNASNAASELLSRARRRTAFRASRITSATPTAISYSDCRRVERTLQRRGWCSVAWRTNAVALVATVSADFTPKVQAGKIIQPSPDCGRQRRRQTRQRPRRGKDASKLDEALTKARSLLN